MASRPSALEFKGRSLPITRVRVLDGASAALENSVSEFARKMPQAVKGLAVIIDSDIEADLELLLNCLRAVGIQPLAVSEGPLAAAARKRLMPVVSRESASKEIRAEPAATAPPPAPSPPPPPPPPAPVIEAVAAPRRAARIIVEPVRSGQQIYAEHTDLIVLNTVSVGAEVIADGCVHIYGALRGRAVAGARGDETARVFCRKLEAELIAVAGVYAVAEQIRDGPRGTAAQAYLDHGKLKIEAHIV
jgi:septum site-determining protein MinC